MNERILIFRWIIHIREVKANRTNYLDTCVTIFLHQMLLSESYCTESAPGLNTHYHPDYTHTSNTIVQTHIQTLLKHTDAQKHVDKHLSFFKKYTAFFHSSFSLSDVM